MRRHGVANLTATPRSLHRSVKRHSSLLYYQGPLVPRAGLAGRSRGALNRRVGRHEPRGYPLRYYQSLLQAILLCYVTCLLDGAHSAPTMTTNGWMWMTSLVTWVGLVRPLRLRHRFSAPAAAFHLSTQLSAVLLLWRVLLCSLLPVDPRPRVPKRARVPAKFRPTVPSPVRPQLGDSPLFPARLVWMAYPKRVVGADSYQMLGLDPPLGTPFKKRMRMKEKNDMDISFLFCSCD